VALAPAHAAPPLKNTSILKSAAVKPHEDLFRFAPGKYRPLEIAWPENYIEPTLKYGLNMVLPQAVQKSLNFSAGYDRWAGLPTLNADYFMPVKAWNDKSLFFAPRLSITGKREAFSFGAGVRHLMTSDTMVGFHAFHDWVRPRRPGEEFLKQAGFGVEFSTLPGNHSDLSFSVNAYFPTNEKLVVGQHATTLVKESLPTGLDARFAFLLPPLVAPLDMRLSGRVHSYQGERTNMTGYNAALTVSSRDGMFNASLEHAKDTGKGEELKVEGNITLAFDWTELFTGKTPFSAPYQASDTRFDRRIRDSLYNRVVRKHDLPADRSEKRLNLLASVSQRTVAFTGGFPDLPHAQLTVQVSQSPWRDCAEVVSDSRGLYSGKVTLRPGKYRIRLFHKGSGRISDEREVLVRESD